MHRILFLTLAFIGIKNAYADPIVLELKHEKILHAFGPLDGQYQIPAIVLAYIKNTTDLESNSGQALLQLAKDYAYAVENLSEPDLAIPNARQILKSEFCVRFYFGASARFQNAKIHALTLNTYESARLGIRLNTHISKALPYLPEESDWKNECRFGEKS